MKHLLVCFYVSEEVGLNSCRMQNGGQDLMAFFRFFMDCKATITPFSFIKPASHTAIVCKAGFIKEKGDIVAFFYL